MFTRPLSIAALSQTAPYDTFLFRSAARPIYRGEPGYRVEMDGDGDGIACEPYRGN